MANKDELTDHNYDGIQEYDNDLPRWWVNLFWITVIWGLGYAIWFHLPSTPSPQERLASQMEELKGLASAKAGTATMVGDAELIAMSKDSAVVAKGGAVFAGKCVVCHGPQGQGVVGPNLTDDYWIHGGKPSDIRRTILEGVPEKGMLSWKALLTTDEVNSVIAFVWSIHGSNPPNPKAPQGDLVTRE